MSHERLRSLLIDLTNTIRDAVIQGRAQSSIEAMSAVAHVSAADTIYEIDKVSEEAILHWFEKNWPAGFPVEVVMEGIDDDTPPCFPKGTKREDTQWKCILDPIDGTRNIMYDKRSAWALAAIGAQRGAATTLKDLQVAVMTELPTSKQWRADQISAVSGRGKAGVIGTSYNVLTGEKTPLTVQPSKAIDFKHSFASLARFFPDGKGLTAALEEELWQIIFGGPQPGSPMVFDDQYICSGGQMYEILVGHDRMIGDLRPYVYRQLGYTTSLVCHPYDVCGGLILEEVGCLFESPTGGAVTAPLDTVSPVAWIGFANPALAELIRKPLHTLIQKYLPKGI
jgi:fructose-1,6-bisphosphatase/inositol monophosphatase family enzyme